jgi:hypothetical protein
MRAHRLATLLLGAATLVLLTATAGGAQPSSGETPQCFYSTDWHGWKASHDDRSIFIGVGGRRVYRLDLATPCPQLSDPMAHLVTKMRGSASICGPLDFDLRVSTGGGFETACIVSNLTPLSAAEASSLPRDLRP